MNMCAAGSLDFLFFFFFFFFLLLIIRREYEADERHRGGRPIEIPRNCLYIRHVSASHFIENLPLARSHEVRITIIQLSQERH